MHNVTKPGDALFNKIATDLDICTIGIECIYYHDKPSYTNQFGREVTICRDKINREFNVPGNYIIRSHDRLCSKDISLL